MGKEVSPDAVRLYVTFVQENVLCMPERTKAAPTRRKDETASAWLGVSRYVSHAGSRQPRAD